MKPNVSTFHLDNKIRKIRNALLRQISVDFPTSLPRRWRASALIACSTMYHVTSEIGMKSKSAEFARALSPSLVIFSFKNDCDWQERQNTTTGLLSLLVCRFPLTLKAYPILGQLEGQQIIETEGRQYYTVEHRTKMNHLNCDISGALN